MAHQIERLLRRNIAGFTLRGWFIGGALVGALLVWAVGWRYGLGVTAIAWTWAIVGTWLIDRAAARRNLH